MIIINTTDFEQLLSTSNETQPILQSYIDKWEKKYIHRILGIELGDLFIADLVVGVPQTARFTKIFEALNEQEGEGILTSDGMKSILKQFIFYHYVSETQVKHSQGGAVVLVAETATVFSAEGATSWGEQKFNEALIWAQTIQMYCGQIKSADYPEFSGVWIKPLCHWII